MKRLLALIAALTCIGLAALAQSDDPDRDNGFLINMLENQLSAPGRQIRVEGVSGILSSQARIGEITVSDAQGAWLTLENVELDWTRSALLLGRLNVDRLSAEKITLARQPIIPPTPVLERTEAKPFELPSLPVQVRLRQLDIARFVLDPAVAGTGAELSLTGNLNLIRGALDSNFAMRRLDGPGGTLDLAASFSNATRQLGIDLNLDEPEGGLVANLLRIENEPPIRLTLKGNGPLDNVDITFALDAAADRIAGGTLALRQTPDGLGFSVDLRGGLSPMIPPTYRDFFAGETALTANGVRRTDGGTRLDALSLKGAVLSLDGSFDTTPDGFPRAINLNGTLGDAAAPPVTLPVAGGDTRLNSARLYLSYGEASHWNGFVVLDRLSSGGIDMEDVTLNMGGLASSLEDPARRSVTLTMEGLATGVSTADRDMAEALGSRFDLFADVVMPPGGPVDVRQLQLTGSGLSIFSAGSFADGAYTGRNSARIDDLAPFSGLARRPLGGAIDVDANGSVTPLSGGFDLALDGTATDLALGDTRADALLAGETRLGGQVTRDAAGIRAEGFRLANGQLELTSDGRISTTGTDFRFDARLNDLALVDPRLGGALTASGTAKGPGRAIDIDVTAAIPEGRLMDRPLTGARLGVKGTVNGTDITADLDGAGQFGDLPLTLAGNIVNQSGAQEVNGLRAAVGANTIAGDLARASDGLITGTLALRAPDIAPVAALALANASGAIEADLAFAPDSTGQGVRVNATGREVAFEGNSIATLDLDASIADALGVPLVNGTLSATDIAAGGVEAATLSARAQQTDANRMTFTADSRLVIGTLIDLSGTLDRLNPGTAITLETLRLRQDPRVATLTAPATVTLLNGTTTLTPLDLDFGTGHLTAQGSIAETFDLALKMTTLPLDLANAVAPALGIAGTLDGTASVTGPRAAPNVTFNVTGANIASTATRDAGLPPLGLTATGATANNRLTLDARANASDGLSATVAGSVPMATTAGPMDLAINLEAFQLVLIDRLAGNQGLTGTVTGTARIGGPLDDPEATFDLRGTGLSARLVADNGIPPAALTANGGFRRQTLTIGSARLTGAGGVDLTASGRVPLSGPGLDVTAAGNVPLSLANPVLATRDAQAAGTIRVNASVQGSLAAPRIGGTATMTGGTIIDPQTNVRLNDVALDLSATDSLLTLRNLSATSAAGGGLRASGTLGLTGNLPANLELAIDNLRYTDGSFIATRLNGNLALRGPVLGNGGTLSGTIDLGTTEISVAEGLGAGGGAQLEQVIHHLPPPRVRTTLARAGIDVDGSGATAGGGRSAGPSSNLALDVRIRAPRQIFIRGRGLDVELGGEMVVRGTLSDVQPVGQFDLLRGRLNILAQRIDFTQGSLQLVGNLDPEINLVAETQSADVTAYVTVSGRVSAPQITFSSNPVLPQDEVLARIIFNRSADTLSPFQLAQLAAAAAELAGGGGGNGLMDQLRTATGLDDLDIITQENGSTAVRAGRHINERVYVDVQTASDGVTQFQINLEVSRFVSARGSVSSDGDSTIGMFYERDY